MKQARIAEPIARTEAAIINDIAGESEHLGAAEQEFSGLEARRSRMLASGAELDEIHQLADSLARAKLKVEIAETRIGALNQELKRFYAAAARAAVDAAMAPLAAIDAEERATVRSYEEHAAAVAADLAKLVEIDARRHQVSVAVHRLTGAWTPAVSAVPHASSLAQVKLPSAIGQKDFWPSQAAALIEVQERAARDAAALAEYRQNE